MSKPSNFDLLNAIFDDCENGSLLEQYDTVRKDTKVKFKCDKCNNEDSKCFYRIIEAGPYCKKCIMKERKAKLEKTMMDRYGVKNANDIPGIKEKMKATKDAKYTKEEQKNFLKKCHEGSKKRWEKYRNEFRPFLDTLKKDGKAICKHCNEEKAKERFQKYKSHYTNEELYEIKCYDCRYKEKSEIKENKKYTVEAFLKCLLADTKNRNDCKKTTKFSNFEITHEDLISLWKKQDGKCCYSGRNMVYNYSKKNYLTQNYNPEKASIDRIDSSKGYLKDNIVLCCARANTIKMDLSLDELQKWIYDINKTLNGTKNSTNL